MNPPIIVAALYHFVRLQDPQSYRQVLLDLRGQSDLCDYQFICSGESDRQTQAIAEAIELRCKQIANVRPIAIEGKQSGHWILLDYGSTLVHVFQAALRDYYALEALWPKARFVDLKELT